MITPQQLNFMSSKTVGIYRELEVEIFKKVASRLSKNQNGDILDWQLKKMSELNLLNKEVTALLSEYSNVAKEEIERSITEAGYKIIDDTDSYMAEKKPTPKDIDKVINGYVNQTFVEIDNYVNQTLITTNYGNRHGTIGRMYQDIIISSVAKFNTGIFTLKEAVEDTVMKWCEKGIQSTFVDKGGHRWSVERYVNMVMKSTMQRTYNEIRVERMSDYGITTVLVSSHPKARPACSLCQGQVLDVRPIHQNNSEYRSVYEFGYGEAAGHRGINCTHRWYPFVPGVSKNNQVQYDPDEAIANENIEQNRKRLAREIVTAKKKLIIAKEMKSDNISKYQKDLTTKRQRMANYVKDNKLKRRYDLEKVYLDKSSLVKGGYKEVLTRPELRRLNNRYTKLVDIIGAENSPKSFDDFLNLKYNNTENYNLLLDYTRSRKSNMISAFSSFSDYKKYIDLIEKELIGINTVDGVKIKSYSKHFIERVLGTSSDPKTNKHRNGVEVEHIKNALLKGNHLRSLRDNSVNVYMSDRAKVTINIETGNIIQVSPQSKKNKGGKID